MKTARKKHHFAVTLIALVTIPFIFLTCGPQREITADEPVAVQQGDTQTAETAPEADWELLSGEPRYLRPRTWNLQHQAVRMAFDFEREAVLGETELLLTNKRGRSSELILDSKTTEFHSIRISGEEHDLSFRQDSAIVTIDLGRDFSRGDTLSLYIDFTSFPPSRGLYFVDPLDRDPAKPTQIWTLGQPEDNSFWLPTIDHPAERTTQEFWITVPDSMHTLSNGFLISSEYDEESATRTDYWKLDLPHAPYLFALAAGVYDITERWVDDILYLYYTEPKYAPYKDVIYEQTEDIMAYFNDRFGYHYPWGAYGQVPVHDFIARGMENTTATIYYNLIQHDCRASQDRSELALIVHELVHQWFGNVVTCKDWANLPFNEGFANYFEILYKKDRVGYEEGMWHSLNHKQDYFSESRSYRRPIIFNQYSEPEDMYDRHTYAKAGQVLLMLHDYVGDEVWWSALHNFLHTFEFSAVSMRDVQFIFEQETGENLNGFFDQWFYEPGHPEVETTWTQNDEGKLIIQLEQIHDMERQPLFQLHSEVEIITESGSELVKLHMDSERITLEKKPGAAVRDVIFDPRGIQLAEIFENTDSRQLAARLKHTEPAVRFRTLRYITGNELSGELAAELKEMVSNDTFGPFRAMAMAALEGQTDPDILELALSIDYGADTHFETRRNALRALSFFPEAAGVRTRLREAVFDTSYFVSAEAKRLYAAMGYDDALEVIEPFADAYSWNHITRLAVVDAAISLAKSGSDDATALLLEMASHPGSFTYKTRALNRLRDTQLPAGLHERALEVFGGLLEDPYSSNRQASIRALAAMESEQAERVLQNFRENAATEQERTLLDGLN